MNILTACVWQDGVVDSNEFKQLMESKYGSDMDVQAAFNKFDVNNDGVLDKEEMKAVQLELEQDTMREGAGGGHGHGVRSEVLEAQLERIETFLVAVHGSCNVLHEHMAQVTAPALRCKYRGGGCSTSVCVTSCY